ncbi:restriction modification system DNA specificity domain-containing protein [Campylobacter showae CC57C]|uniref:Restriction modification system DNA specificity domain-containing protein n=1 Tax=Campylobacter showae CC57C TaxID=1073353 RepID=M3JAP9_9BACT|nr:restriction endonuclease subunit S [Campylobacter showae]EMG29767.1 restriction modification system DNA specificity domain-containing protein [Campylobacter showae CC57C]
MNRYENYSDSDLTWAEIIPEHWEVKRIARVFDIRKEKNFPIKTKEILSLSAKYGVSLYSDKKEKGGNKPKEDLTSYSLCYPGDILINCMNVVAGSVGISNYFGAVSPVYYPLVNMNQDENCTRYMEYVFRNYNFQRSLVGLGKGIQMTESEDGKLFTVRMRIAWDMLKTQLLPIPPINEQEQIADYLDWKINEIDRLIEINKEKIKCLRKYTISSHEKLILKNSEFKEWIVKDNIYNFKNQNFRIKKLKSILVKIENNALPGSDIIICSNSGKSFVRGDKKIGLYSDDINMYQNVNYGQIMIHGMDTWHGAICISKHSGRCTRVVHVCETTEDKMYVYYYLRLLAFLKLYKPFSNGVRQNTSDFRSWDRLGQVNIILPTIEQQHKIAEQLTKLINGSEKMIDEIMKENDMMDSLKQSLISEVVTGKIDVRNVVIPEYEKVTLLDDEIEEFDEMEGIEDGD